MLNNYRTDKERKYISLVMAQFYVKSGTGTYRYILQPKWPWAFTKQLKMKPKRETGICLAGRPPCWPSKWRSPGLAGSPKKRNDSAKYSIFFVVNLNLNFASKIFTSCEAHLFLGQWEMIE
jgi:hypothetical protein